MRYMGGKHRQSKGLLNVLSSRHTPDTPYCEPFMGALGSAEKLVPYFGNGVLSDASQPLVTMWEAILSGWVPPDTVSDEEYRKYADKRHCPDTSDPLTAWMGYAMSFGGKWFGGLARQGADDPQGTARSQRNQKAAALRKASAIRGKARIMCLDYTEALQGIAPGSVVYLDPPYADRTKAHHTAKGFDSNAFWEQAKVLSNTCHVYVSEFTAPKGWVPVYSWGDTVVRHNGGGSDGTNEALFVWEGA